MKVKLIFNVLLVTVFVFSLSAQVDSKHKINMHPEKKAADKVERFSNTTEVSNDEKEALVNILSEYYTQKKALSQNADKTKSDWIALKEDKNEKIKAVLSSEEQYNAWSAFEKQDYKVKKEYKHSEKRQKNIHRQEFKKQQVAPSNKKLEERKVVE